MTWKKGELVLLHVAVMLTMLLVDDNTIDMGLFNRPGEYVHTEITVSNRDKKKEEKMPKICPLQHITLLPFFDKFGLYVKMA